MKNPFLSCLIQTFSTSSTKKTSGEQAVIAHEDVQLYGNTEDSSVGKVQPSVSITTDEFVRVKYAAGWVDKIRSVAPEEIVIHGTAGGKSTAGLLHWMYNWGRPKYNKGIGLFHYAIGRGEKGEKDGLIVEVISPEYYVYHSTSGKHAKREIGIELLNPSKSNRDSYTDLQYKSLFKLIFDHLFILYPTVTRIVGHRYNIWKYNSKKAAQKYDKNCPGNFEQKRLEEELEKRGYSYEIEGQFAYYNIAKQQA